MTDTVAFYRNVVAATAQFINAFEALTLLADRIAADSALSTATAQTAQGVGRTDLTAANFDNFRLAVNLISNKLNASDASVPNGGTVRLSFYQLI